ncbi:conjugal transfer protein (plasmid) [Paenibacillus sonchi]|uniref:Conjugal transfer protein n=1 Tax=Paenibacillus sonchi TaxID=373687 RepID=A0A974PJI0_9BACL|nr:TcpE family conjugal transfer membrane protein [Paenibacillus sonchi]QQZ64626.1 conjugal transfer protein [Paenibacillus sonchi]
MSEKQDPPRVTVSNYTRIWNLDWVIYAFEGKKLPFPANLRIIATFVVVEIIWLILGKTLFFFLPGTYSYVVLPVATTWLISKQKLDGKAPHKWLLSMICYWMRPKRLNRYRKLEHNKHYVYQSKVVYRTKRERA